MATIDALPLECICNIFALGCEDFPETWSHRRFPQNKRITHPCLSLSRKVCSRWKEISQTLLAGVTSGLFCFSFLSLRMNFHEHATWEGDDILIALASFRRGLMNSNGCLIDVEFFTDRQIDPGNEAGRIFRELFIHGMDMLQSYSGQLRCITFSSQDRHLQAHCLCCLNQMKLSNLEEVKFIAWGADTTDLATFQCRAVEGPCETADHKIFRPSTLAIINTKVVYLAGVLVDEIEQLPTNLRFLTLNLQCPVTSEQLQRLLNPTPL